MKKKVLIFYITNGVLLFKGRYALSPTSEIILDILREYHDSPIGGHSGAEKTIKKLVIFSSGREG